MPESFRDRSPFLYDVRLRSYGTSICPIFGFWPIFSIQNPGDQPTAQGLQRRMIPIFRVIVECPKRKVPSGTEDFLWLLVGELGPPNLPKFSPMENGYIHTEYNCTARQIWTKDVWKRAILRTDVLSHQISSPLLPKSPKTPFWGTFQCKTYYTHSSP